MDRAYLSASVPAVNLHIASSLFELGSKVPIGKHGLEPLGIRKHLGRSSQIVSASVYHHQALVYPFYDNVRSPNQIPQNHS